MSSHRVWKWKQLINAKECHALKKQIIVVNCSPQVLVVQFSRLQREKQDGHGA